MPLLAEMHPSWAVRWTLTLSADHRGVLHDRLGEPWLERRGEGAWLLDASGPPELSGVPGLPEGHLVPSLNL